LEKQLAQGDPQAQAQLGRALLRVTGATPETLTEGLALLEKAASQGDPQLQYELGRIFLFGRHGLTIDLPRGRKWWAKALEKNQVKTMEYVAAAYQNGHFGYPVDLLKSKALVRRLVEAYRDGLYGVDPDPVKERYWSNELKYFDRLFELAGGSYQSPNELLQKAEKGDPQAQYQLGRQLMVAGPAEHRQQGLVWIERAAEGGYPEAQYRLVTYFERQAGIMRNDPARGVAMLQAAAEQKHLPAMGALALGYTKGRYGLIRDYSKAKNWYERLLKIYESGSYLGEIGERFIPFQRRQLKYTTKALETQIEKVRRYEEASPLERQIIEIEDRYRIEYQKAVNALDRRDGSPAGQERTRAEIKRLRKKYNRLREEEIARIAK
jgi:TPR repeat protein